MALLLFATIGPASAQQPANWAIPGGHFFTETAGGQGGLAVVDDADARFWSELQRPGGSQTVGYPIEHRYVFGGFLTQPFQKLILQWRVDVGQALPLNTFDVLSGDNWDEVLYSSRQTPRPLVNFDPPGAATIPLYALHSTHYALRSHEFPRVPTSSHSASATASAIAAITP